MKDSYSFDRDIEGLDRSYALHIEAYDRIFDRCGLRTYRVESDVGMMGGLGAHDYMAPCAAGENEIALAPGYAADVEVAVADPQPVELPPALGEPREAPTPGLTTVEEVAGALGVPAGALIKAMPVIVNDRMVLALVRGDHRLNELKLRKALEGDFRLAHEEEIAAKLGPPGFIGPVGAELPILKDAAIQGEGYVCGANRADAHLIGVSPGRDFSFEEVDIRSVEAGDVAPGGGRIELERAIEVAGIFKLGTRYSEPLGATYLDERGQEHPIVMGSYGIGPARIVAAAIEQGADEKGIVWPRVDRALGRAPRWARQARRRGDGGGRRALRGAPSARERRSCYDDRDAGPGQKLTDAELLGCPIRLVVGRRALAEGARRGTGTPQREPTSACPSPRQRAGPSSCSMASTRRLFGLDRSGPSPPQTRRGEPLRPLTIPNLVGYVRLAGIPVFLYLALSSADGRTAAVGDPLPGDLGRRLSRRLPGPGHRPVQPHGRAARPGDRSADDPRRARRLLAGSSSCRAGRWRSSPPASCVTLVLAQIALRRGVDLEINWVGRTSVWLTMGGIFLALATSAWIATAVFLIGLDRIAARPRRCYVSTGLRGQAAARRLDASAGAGLSCRVPQPQLDLCGAPIIGPAGSITPREGAREWRKPFPTSAR